MNTMNNPKIEVIRFASEDIITTSTPAIDDDGVKIIWLDATSVVNFNAFPETHDILEIPYRGRDYDYYAYNGDNWSGYFWCTTGANEGNLPSGAYVNNMTENDVDKYNLILSWLNNHGQK